MIIGRIQFLRQIKLQEPRTVFKKYNTKISIGKTKAIAYRIKSRKKCSNIKISNENIGEISEFCYLGSKIIRDGRCNANIHSTGWAI